MRRDIPIMVYQAKNGEVICKACNTINHFPIYETTIHRCVGLFVRHCSFNDDRCIFDNTTCKIIMSIDGTCKIKEISNNCSNNNPDCSVCSIKHNAIIQYKQNNNL